MVHDLNFFLKKIKKRVSLVVPVLVKRRFLMNTQNHHLDLEAHLNPDQNYNSSDKKLHKLKKKRKSITLLPMDLNTQGANS